MVSSVEDFLNRLHHPTLASIDLKLDRMMHLLRVLGSPEKRLPPVIHVAGTNGKGSLLAYLQAIFEAAGYRVHRYTSPHLVHFRERITLQGKWIENAQLENILRHVAPIIQANPATFFEATTAIAFLAFAEKPADILLLETGLGGRLDATNVIEKPLLTAITPIAFDHTEYLGKTIEAIAGEKAGIIKHGVPCVIGRQEFTDAAAVLDKKAAELSAPLYRLGQEWQVKGDQFTSPKHQLTLAPSLAGTFQYDNAATAVACIEQLPQFTIAEEHIAQGLANTVWPARLQKLTHGRYRDILPEGIELWLDGGHNPQGGQVLADWLATQKKDIYLICGMVGGKDAGGFLKPSVPYVKQLYAITIPQEPQSQPAAKVAAAAVSVGIEAHAAPSVEQALQTIATQKTPAIVCICGSLYLAGKILATN